MHTQRRSSLNVSQKDKKISNFSISNKSNNDAFYALDIYGNFHYVIESSNSAVINIKINYDRTVRLIIIKKNNLQANIKVSE